MTTQTTPKAKKATCSRYGICWSCDGKFYTGHHKTRNAAIEAGKKNFKLLRKILGEK